MQILFPILLFLYIPFLLISLIFLKKRKKQESIKYIVLENTFLLLTILFLTLSIFLSGSSMSFNIIDFIIASINIIIFILFMIIYFINLLRKPEKVDYYILFVIFIIIFLTLWQLEYLHAMLSRVLTNDFPKI
jgi:hypothetical protein